MYFTDEFMDQWGEDLDRENCPHDDTGVELLTNNPDGPTALVCYQCRTTLKENP